MLNALYFLPLLILNKNRTNIEIVAKGKLFPNIKEFLSMLLTFSLTTIAWIFFRSKNIVQAFGYMKEIFSSSLFKYPEVNPKDVYILIFLFMVIEWMGRESKYAIEKIGLNWYKPIRGAFYLFLAFLVFLFQGQEQTFIYFQF
jgi:hypothetical protein